MTTKDDIEQLFRSHYAAIYRLAMLILREDDVARDIVHDVFEALLVSGRTGITKHATPYRLRLWIGQDHPVWKPAWDMTSQSASFMALQRSPGIGIDCSLAI